MPRFFTEQISGDTAVISGEDGAHIARVLRMRAGQEITLCDGRKTDYYGVISSVAGNEITVDIQSRQPSLSEPGTFLTLYQAIPKGDKLEFIIQKAVELGVSRIVPVLTKRCVSRPDETTMAKKLARYQKIAQEAAKQCGRGIIPDVSPMLSFAAAVERMANDPVSVLFYENGGKRLNTIIGQESNAISFMVGSEGGFDPDEVDFALLRGIQTATLGRRILRCETAPLCAASIILHLTGDI